MAAPLVDGRALARALDLDYAVDPGGFDTVSAAASAVTAARLTTTVDHSTHPQCIEAALHVATDMYQARSATGGQTVGVDFQPGPYRMSAWTTRRTDVLVAGCLDPTGMVG